MNKKFTISFALIIIALLVCGYIISKQQRTMRRKLASAHAIMAMQDAALKAAQDALTKSLENDDTTKVAQTNDATQVVSDATNLLNETDIPNNAATQTESNATNSAAEIIANNNDATYTTGIENDTAASELPPIDPQTDAENSDNA